MILLHQNLKQHQVKLKIESPEDLWYLSYIIEPDDRIRARTMRKIKIGGEEQRNVKVVKKAILLQIQVEKVEFHTYSDILRVNGTILQGPEEVSQGSFHTINLQQDSVFELEKDAFQQYQLTKLQEACAGQESKILICVHNREEAYFALLKRYGFELLSKISGDVPKKTDQQVQASDFYAQIQKMLEAYDTRYELDHIIIASPSFWKEYLMKRLDSSDLIEKVVLATCSTVGEQGINEVLKRQEVKQVLQKERAASEVKLVEALLQEIAKEDKAAYGLKEVAAAVDAGAVADLLISDTFILEKREKEKFKDIDSLMKKVEKRDGKVHIISSKHDGGRKLDGLGGVGAILRYRIR